jgi:twitching motility protein PilT
MSQLVPLLTKLKESGAERVYFAPNELAYALDGEMKRPMAGNPVSAAVLLEAISELLSHDDIQGLSTTRPRIVRHEHDGEDFVFEIVKRGSGIAVGIRQAVAKPARGLRESFRRDDPSPPPPKAEPPKADAEAKGKVAPPKREDPPSGKGGRTKKVRGASVPPMNGERELEAKASAGPEPELELDLGLGNSEHPELDPSRTRDVQAKLAKIGDTEGVRRVSVRPPVGEDVLSASREAARETAREVAREVALEVTQRVRNTAPSMVHEPAPLARRETAFVRSGPARIDALLRDMLQRRASDLHLTPNAHPVLRIDGEIHFGKDRPILASDEILEMVREIMPPAARSDFDDKHDADFAYELPGQARFRVNVFEERHGTGAVLRQIPIEIASAEKLGLPKACIDLCWLTKGLVLVTGPTGSGKSTTLAAMIDFINRNRSEHIITIEDPVEFVHKNQKCLVNQREVGQHTTSFRNALRAALREDPDIVLVGELRDLETIAIAIETAETGHLVFGTLHTTTAISTIDRVIDQFPADRQEQIRVMLSESLKGVVAQVLLPRIGGGRVAAYEILLGSTAVAAMIRDGKTFQITSVMQTSKGQGMVTMNDSLLQLVQNKTIDPKQAYLKAVDKTGFTAMLRAAGIAPPV